VLPLASEAALRLASEAACIAALRGCVAGSETAALLLGLEPERSSDFESLRFGPGPGRASLAGKPQCCWGSRGTTGLGSRCVYAGLRSRIATAPRSRSAALGGIAEAAAPLVSSGAAVPLASEAALRLASEFVLLPASEAAEPLGFRKPQ
jgi:hypothetical protein